MNLHYILGGLDYRIFYGWTAYLHCSIEAIEIKGTDSSTNSIQHTGVQYLEIMGCKNGAQQKKTLSLMTVLASA